MSATTLGPSPAAAPLRTAVVVDTNAALDLWLFQDPRVQGLRLALEKRQLRWLACPAMREELAHVLDRGLAQARGVEGQSVLRAWDEAVEHPLLPDPEATAVSRLHCSDPDDQKFLELALSAGSKYLLTSDSALLKLARRAAPRGLHICRPYGWTP